MYRIGELSALTGVPVKTLRYWSDLRVLVPDLTDRFTGYRYYSDENLEDCRKVIAMKEMGFTLDEIRERDDLLNLAKRKLTETREIIGNLKRREERLEALIGRILKGDSDMTNLSEKIELAQKEAFVNDPGELHRPRTHNRRLQGRRDTVRREARKPVRALLPDRRRELLDCLRLDKRKALPARCRTRRRRSLHLRDARGERQNASLPDLPETHDA